MTPQHPIELLLGITSNIFERNLTGIDHEASVRSIAGGGNCVNWIAGHILVTRNVMFTLLREPSPIPADMLALYERGSENVTPENAFDLDTIKKLNGETLPLLIAALGRTDLEKMHENSTLFDEFAILCFHESYHVGQLGLARRSIGLGGAIK